MTGASLFWLTPVIPLASALVLAAGLGSRRRLAAAVAIAALASASLTSALTLVAVANGETGMVSIPWASAGGRTLSIALWMEPLGAVIAFLVSIVSLAVFVYAASYMADDPRAGRFFSLFTLFAGSMLALVLSGDLLLLFVAWESVGLCSYLLIGFWFERPGVPGAAMKAFLTTRLADLPMLAGIVLLIGAAGGSDIATALAAVQNGKIDSTLLLAIAMLLFAGAAGKSAQFPFHAWLPDAMAGPTPVSALLHSATMVAAGVFLVARLYPLFLAQPESLRTMAWIGIATALLGGLAALVQTDLKRTLACSTMSQLGLMFVGLGSGSLLAGVLLLVAQALYKAPLFLAAGAIDHAVGGTSFDRMGGLARRMPFTLAVFGVAASALAGLPVTLALPAKDPLIAAAHEAGVGLFIATLAASFVTALYSGRILGLVFWGRPPEPARRAHEATIGLLAPMIAFGGAMVLGLAANSSVFARPLGRLLGLETTESFATNAIAMAIAAIGFVLGVMARRLWPDQVIWPALQTIAPVISEVVAMNRLYRAFAAIGLRGAHLLAALDRRVFDRIAQTVARISMPAVRRLAALDHRVFDRTSRSVARIARSAVGAAAAVDRTVFDAAARSGASWGLALVRGAIRIDVAAVERSSAAFGNGVLEMGRRLQRLQTGRVENYLMTIFLWSLAIAFLVVAS